MGGRNVAEGVVALLREGGFVDGMLDKSGLNSGYLYSYLFYYKYLFMQLVKIHDIRWKCKLLGFEPGSAPTAS